jgi:hypothetical protein
MNLLAIVLVFCIAGSYALDVDDFVPAFLMPTKSESSNDEPVKPLVDIKRNSSSTTSWYCNRNHGNSVNVFCNKNNSSQVVYSVTYESSPNAQANKIIDDSVAGTDVTQNTYSNQKTLQNQDVRNTLEKTQGAFALPISPSDDVKMNINQQQVQFNIKY